MCKCSRIGISTERMDCVDVENNITVESFRILASILLIARNSGDSVTELRYLGFLCCVLIASTISWFRAQIVTS